MSRGIKYDNKVLEVIGGIADCFILGVLWIITSIPIFTIGASSSAIYYTINKSVVGKDGYVCKTYIESFKANFKQATLTWLIYMVLIIFLFVDIFMFRNELKNNSMLGALYYFFIVVGAVVQAWLFYLFPYISRFEGTIKETMFKSFSMMIVNPGWSVMLVIVFYAAVYICNDIQFLFLILPGAFGYVLVLVLERVFKKYIDEDKVAE